MISDTIRNVIRRWTARAQETGELSTDEFSCGCAVLMEAADRVERIETAPIREAQRGDYGDYGKNVIDFTARKAERDIDGWLRTQGLKVPPRTGPGGAA